MRFRLDVDGERREIEVEAIGEGFVIRIEGATYRARARPAVDAVDVRIGAKRYRLRIQGNRVILNDQVHRLRIADISEAMKMQNEIPAPGDGVVRQVAVAEGETITADRVVASIELGGPSAS